MTKWHGLYRKDSGFYRSDILDKNEIGELPEKFRVLLKYSKYYDKSKDKSAQFVIAIVDADGKTKPEKLPVSSDEVVNGRIEEIRKIITEGNKAMDREYSIDEGYRVMFENYRRLIGAVEELTGMEVRFEY